MDTLRTNRGDTLNKGYTQFCLSKYIAP